MTTRNQEKEGIPMGAAGGVRGDMIRIAMSLGDPLEVVDAVPCDVPGLAVAERLFGFALVHIDSGTVVLAYFSSAAEAHAAAPSVDSFDWTLPGAVLRGMGVSAFLDNLHPILRNGLPREAVIRRLNPDVGAGSFLPAPPDTAALSLLESPGT